ncbi:MAG: hypothetical protein COV45_04880 [Deltaproteobacteria bacterium CG11_big_fil_rev_8_21_14_0_20_47_16]|nr:MAG: hypothetical protein COV45_04880 [Deltaproteobacteria bacterium CG11_big_fil_rev_8_21_14_0_20_47_16]
MKRDIQTVETQEFSLELENNENLPAKGKDALLELQMTMATSSINHEYARIEYEDSMDAERKDELVQFMEDCHSKYQEAREKLAATNPQTLESFEKDLAHQKQSTITHYNA